MGLQMSLFYTGDLANPTLIDRLIIEDSANLGLKNEVAYDLRAFHLFPSSKKLLLPATVTDSDDIFDGFLVFDVSQESISFSFSISHVDSSSLESSCWYNAYL